MRNVEPGFPDFALVYLDHPVPHNFAAPLVLSGDRIDKPIPVWQAGYSRGQPLKFRKGVTAQMHVSPRLLRFHENLTMFGGDSGSPVFNYHNQVVGIVSARAGFEEFRLVIDEKTKEPKIESIVYQTAACKDLKQWGQSFRVDYLRWFLERNAKLRLTLSFYQYGDKEQGLVDSLQPCTVKVTGRWYDRTTAQEFSRPIGSIELAGRYSADAWIDFGTDSGNQNTLPCDILGFELALGPMAGLAPEQSYYPIRSLNYMKLRVSSPNQAEEASGQWLDLTKLFNREQSVSADDPGYNLMSYDTIRPRFDSAMENLIFS
jgi:hypothetical protein